MLAVVSRLVPVTTIPSPAAGMRELGDYLRQQRIAANLSVRQLSAVTGISNPYLSQIERGLRRPSADILQQLAQGLSLSAESLYIRAGLLDPEHGPHGADARMAIRNDPRLDGPQRRALLDAYARLVGDGRYAVVDTAPASPSSLLDGSQQYPSEFEEKDMNAKSDQSGQDTERDLEKSALTPLYAMVGASDLAVEKLVELGQKAAKDAETGIDDLQHRADELQHRANRDMSKAIKGARQLPQEAAKQAKEAVQKGRKQYRQLARRGKDVDLAGQATSTAQGIMKQAGEIAGRGRKEAAHVVDARVHQAGKVVDRGRHQAEHMVEQGRHQAEHFVEHRRHQAEHLVEQGRAEAEKRVQEGRRVAKRTRRVAAEQADRVADQATQVVEAVSHVGRRPVAAAMSATADVRKPMARRRRSPGSTEARTVVSAGVDAGATTPTAKKPAAKKATSKKAATKKAAASKPVAKRASSTPAGATVAKRATKRATKATATASAAPAASPSDMPASPAATPIIPEPAPASTPSDKLPTSSEE